jgi:PAS domain S-box-containing protein
MYHTIANGEVWRAEICNRAKDGSIYWVDTTVVPFLDAYGKPRQYMAIRADITERKRAEEGRERLAAVVESSDDAIISKAMDGTITGWNAGAEKVFGYSSSEAVGKSMRMLMPPDRINEEFEILARIKRGESVEHFETVRVRKGGKRIDIAATISPIRDSSGAIVGISKIARDVSERKHAEEALREQAQVLDSAQVFVRDMKSRVVFWPRGAEKLYGFTSQEALGILSHDLFHTIFPEPLEAVEKKLFETGMWEGELVHRRRDGVTIVVSSAWVLHRNSQGQPIRILETNIDITDRKQAEQRLARQAEELSRQAVELARSRQALETQTLMLQSVLDSMQEGLVAADEQGKFIIWNPAATKILGLGAANLSTQEWTSHYGVYLEDMVTPFPADQLPLVLAIHGEASTAEMFVRNPELDQGTWIEASGGPLKDKEGAVRGGVVAFRDITRRKADEREIRKLNEELEARVLQRTSQLAAANHELADQKFALDQHAIVAMTDVEGTITYANDNFCAISQYSREELIGQNHRMMKSGQHSPEFFQEMYQTIGEGKVWHGEMMNRAKDGSFFWTNTTIVPFAGAGEKARQYAAIRTDITKRKQVEERLLQRTAQVEAANQELEAFTYSVSHDLRAPLRHIGGFSRILMEDFAAHMDPEARHHLERIQDGTHRMGLLVDELLNLARVGRYALKLQVTQLNSVVEEVVTLLQPEVEGRSVEWKIADLPSLECDPILIKQVFQNLIANSLKFTRPRDIAVIEIDYRQENGETVIFVRDNGVGFNMKYTDKLFGVFQRLHRAEDFEGTGIGLATVQRIIHKHRGRVWAEAELDKGATFYFTVGAEPADVKNKTAAAVGA